MVILGVVEHGPMRWISHKCQRELTSLEDLPHILFNCEVRVRLNEREVRTAQIMLRFGIQYPP